MTTYNVVMRTYCRVDIEAGSDAITRITGPKGDDWRFQFYPLEDEIDVLSMFADNLIRNGIEDVSRLEGWGDLKHGAVTMRVTDTEFDHSVTDG